ncbi:T9SS type A sorting domain-containing protein [bacterium]|nr:T9SS type A sorting domain-containing protein [bacterium]
MKKIFITFFAAIVGALAVEWDIEQVTPASEPYNFYPVLALDDQGFAYILYYQWNETPELRVASNATGAWKTRRVTHLTEAFGDIFSIDVDSKGHPYVTYMDSAGPGKYDIFLATDTTGMFVAENLTDDEAYQSSPVLRLYHNYNPHLIYVSEMQLWFGIDNGFDFYNEQVCDNYLQEEWYVGSDYALDPEGGGSAFYIGDDGFLWCASTGVPLASSLPLWAMHKLTDTESFWPSVHSEFFTMHVAYVSGIYPNRIHYISGSGMDWVDEPASTEGLEETMNERPSIALGADYDPHIVWMRSLQVNDTVWQYDLYYTHKTQSGWVEEAVTSTSERDEKPGYGHYFAIDSKGYGHIVWSAPDSVDWIDHIFHAKSRTPIATGIVETPLPPSNSLSMFADGSRIRFELAYSSIIRLSLYDASGRKVQDIATGFYPAGQNEITVNSSALPTGVYFARLESQMGFVNAKFVITR